MMTKRNFIVLLALLLTLWLAYGTQPNDAYQSDQSTILPTRQLSTKQPPIPQLEALVLANRNIASSQFDLFAIAQITQPSKVFKPVNKAHIALKPQIIAPKAPIKYLGRIQTGDVTDVILGVMLDVSGDVMPVQVGDILLGQYQVKSISNTAQTQEQAQEKVQEKVQVQLLYLPLNVMQTIH